MLLRKVVLAGLFLAAAMPAPVLAEKIAAAEPVFYIGTQGEAILAARFDQATGHISYLGPVAQITRPTWLAIDPERPILYSVSEIGNDGKASGSIFSFAIDSATGALTQISKADSGGHGPTYLSYDPRAKSIFVAHFGGGEVAVLPVQPDGSLASPTSVQTDFGHGPHQLGPHAHSVGLDPSGHFVVVPDMGADRIFIYAYDSRAQTLAPASPPFFETGQNTGPRHFVFSQDGRFVYILTELSSEVRAFRWDANAGQLHPIQSVFIDPSTFKGARSAAEIRLSADGRFLYTSNRGRNSLEVFAVTRQSGKLKQVQDIASGGDQPRSFVFDPSGRWMLVAHQGSKSLTVFAVDKKTGKLTAVGSPVYLDSIPVAFAFYQP